MSEENKEENKDESIDILATNNVTAALDLGIPITYVGDLVNNRYHGKGVYSIGKNSTVPSGIHAITYDGEFVDGDFHGHGRLYVDDSGGYFEGIWNKNKLQSGGYIFHDKLKYKSINDDKWNYASKSDPRFYGEIKAGLQLGENLTYETPTGLPIHIPRGCFDTIDGYFDPKKKAVLDYTTGELIRMPDQEEKEWIIENCRNNPIYEDE